jgi:hypothetical protein
MPQPPPSRGVVRGEDAHDDGLAAVEQHQPSASESASRPPSRPSRPTAMV